MVNTLALLLLLSADPAVRLPSPPATPQPPPAPPGTVVKLTADLLYVIDSDVDCLVLSSPQGLVNVSHDAGPIRIRGVFVDGTGKSETRTYKGPHVFTVEPIGTGLVELLIVVPGTSAPEVIRRTIDANVGPRPPPDPPTPPPDPPKPPPTPDGTSPFAEPGFRVLMVFDSENTTRPPTEQSVIYGKTVRDYLDSHCVPESSSAESNGRAYRIYAANSDTSRAPKVWADAFKLAKGKDWILIGDGTKGYSGPLPKSPAEALALLQRFGGP